MIKHTNRFHIDDTTDDVVKDYIINHCKINGINYRGAQIKYSEYRNRYNTISNIGTGEYSILIYYAEDSYILIGSLYKTNYGDGIEVVLYDTLVRYRGRILCADNKDDEQVKYWNSVTDKLSKVNMLMDKL